MTTFQIITVLFGFTSLLGGFIAGYVKIKTDIAKILAYIAELQANTGKKADYDLVLQLQKETNSKLDQMNQQINIIVNKLMK